MSHTDDHDRGLAFDLATLNRRRLLTLFGGAGLATLVGCGAAATSSTSTAGTTSTTTTTSAAAGTANAVCADAIPEETAGPFPADGSNGPNILTASGIVRSDIRSSFGSASGVAKGIPLTIKLTIQDAGKNCAAYAGAAVYLWHCDIDGNYSMYSQAVANENYLRGVQEADAQGNLTFTSIFPAAYTGRWPHIHFEVYPNLTEATKAGEPVSTTQLALPEDVCKTVYATSGYSSSVQNLARTSLDSDNVFRDGHDSQMAAVTGDISSGYVATLTVPV